ncbi:MAG: prepilin-type N-terminal cleavage/methylation domain-containing protein [Planctomycetes bacterium]|nr:prepilin-type N-terminal cleavage/methylation domain-containing protein [Planctomycetota bacterium]
MNPPILHRERRAFTLIELLVAIGVIAVLIALLLPALGAARETGRTAACLSNQRQMVLAWTMYANAYKERVMPLAYWSREDIGAGEQIFWWGTHGSGPEGVNYEKGFIAPFLDAKLSPRSVFECPSQAWGTYRPQGPRQTPTSTYGYNGYYLSPSKTPGWAQQIGFRPWKRLFEIRQPESVFVFADSLLAGDPPSNTALLDPPMVFSSGAWQENPFPTTSFRHHRPRVGVGGTTCAARCDGSVRSVIAEPLWLTDPGIAIGSAGGLDVHYVPDASDW